MGVMIMPKEIAQDVRKAFGEWFTARYIALMQRLNRFIDQGELAQQLEIDRSLVGKYLSGQAIPGDGKTTKIANFFSDEGIYDVLGYDRPKIRPDHILEFVHKELENMDLAYIDRLLSEVMVVKERRMAQEFDKERGGG